MPQGAKMSLRTCEAICEEIYNLFCKMSVYAEVCQNFQKSLLWKEGQRQRQTDRMYWEPRKSCVVETGWNVYGVPTTCSLQAQDLGCIHEEWDSVYVQRSRSQESWWYNSRLRLKTWELQGPRLQRNSDVWGQKRNDRPYSLVLWSDSQVSLQNFYIGGLDPSEAKALILSINWSINGSIA